MQFKRLPNTPDDKLFNMEIFKRTADDTILSRAILNQLNRNPVALKAAWDYNVLKQSESTLEAFQGKVDNPLSYFDSPNDACSVTYMY